MSGEPQISLRNSTEEDWQRLFELANAAVDHIGMDVPDLLFQKAVDELERLGARHAWLREYASDQPRIAYFHSKGFDIREKYEYEGQLLVTLAKNLVGSDLSG